ncbi:hypothetical protein FI667_g13254, partial [Globisporangium splendens]
MMMIMQMTRAPNAYLLWTWTLSAAIATLLFLHSVDAQLGVATDNLCAMLGNCNGHGRCKTCTCFEGYGAASDIAAYKAPDCSLHICPNGCSGHGQCLSMKALAPTTSAFPLSAATTYSGAEKSVHAGDFNMGPESHLWVSLRFVVARGLGRRSASIVRMVWRRLLPEYAASFAVILIAEALAPQLTFQLCRLASALSISGKIAAGGAGTSAIGNKCHVDCANRGKCDFTTGTCTCFDGFYGSNCASLSPIVA